ncbi:AAA family ATPase [Cryobacterium melibiosiphilum]
MMLIVLRGNSGSGKSTIAARLQSELPGSAAVLSQDYFRRTIYDDQEQDSHAHADLLEAAAKHCLAKGQHVILDGIFNAGRYSPMLNRIRSSVNDSRFYAFDLSLEETVLRHQTRSKSVDFTAQDMVSWYHGWQPLSFVQERRIGPHETVAEIVSRVLESR